MAAALISAVFAAVLGGAYTPTPAHSLSVLVFSKTKGFRHDSIPDGKKMMMEICAGQGWNVCFTEDADLFSNDNLKNFDVVMFLLTTGDVLDEKQQSAMERFIRSGGGYVGIHAASDTEYDWAWYGQLVGAYFAGHPAIQQATIHIEDSSHPATKHLGSEWVRTDEWYSFKSNPRSRVHVLATVDESTFQGGLMGKDHPIIWCHDFEGGRAFYTALGHTKESYSEPKFVQMITEAVRWAARR